MDIEFDPDKDRSNIAKHGISLARAAELEILAFVEAIGVPMAKYGIAPGVGWTGDTTI